MIDCNFVSLLILVALLFLWKVELVAVLLDRKSEPDGIPKALVGFMDDSTLHKGRSYRMERARLGVLRSTVHLALLLVFWFAGGFGWLDSTVRSFFGDGIPAGLAFLGVWFLAHSIIDLPFDICDTFLLENRYGFNRSSPATFAMDRIKGLALAVVLGLPIASALLWILGSLSHAWLWAWLVLATFQWLMVWLAPSYIMPIFNRFSPMPDGDLKSSIQELGKNCSFPLDGVFVMDGSRRSTKANAFFTGVGKHKKIALFDTLIDTCSNDEILSVLAHEIGHFRCGHIRRRLIAGMLNLGVLCFLLGICTDSSATAARILFDAFGVKTISPHVGLVLFGILMTPVSTLVAIALNAWSRKHEFEADSFARNALGTGKPLANALLRMTSDHLAHPCPSNLRVWLDFSHPPLLERVRALESANIRGG